MTDADQNESYWQTREGRLNQAIREGLREAGVQGPLADLVGPVLTAVIRQLASDEGQTPMTDQSKMTPCPWCGHVHDPEDGRCDAHANVGIGRCQCPGPQRLNDAEAHLWALVVCIGSDWVDDENDYLRRDTAAAARYVERHLKNEDMTARHRRTLQLASDEENR